MFLNIFVNINNLSHEAFVTDIGWLTMQSSCNNFIFIWNTKHLTYFVSIFNQYICYID